MARTSTPPGQDTVVAPRGDRAERGNHLTDNTEGSAESEADAQASAEASARTDPDRHRLDVPRPGLSTEESVAATLVSPVVRPLHGEAIGGGGADPDKTAVQLSATATTSMVAPAWDGTLPMSSARPPPAAGQAAILKYDVVGEIGHGGGGDVFEVRDNDLRRHVALKRLRREHTDPAMMTLFLQEAQLTAQLEHPNIVPVHELGATATGEPFFTMKRVTGQTLAEVLHRLQRREASAVQRFTRTRMLIVFLEITRGVAHAHARGVVHRDLKAANILIGNHGETLVADWGLACRDTLPPEPVPDAPSPTPAEWPAAHLADIGISGTLQAMAPEQARGDPLDRRADVYALGVILYEILTGERPFTWQTLADAAAPRPRPEAPRIRAPHREIAEELEAICLRCLEPKREHRFGGAGEVSLAVENALTGARRRQQAMQFAAEGTEARTRMTTLRAERDQLRQKHDELEMLVKPWDGVAQKQPLWDVEERLFHLDIAIDDALAVTLDKFNQALGQDESFVDAEDALADLHLALFLDAERHGNRRDMLFHRRLVERHHRGRFAVQLEGKGLVTLRPRIDGGDVDDVIIQAVALVERGKRIVVGEAIALPEADRGGRVQNLSLPMGSYLFTLSAPSANPPRAPAKVHVHVGRQARVELDVHLQPASALEGGLTGFVHIPAGPFIAGGDEQAQNAALAHEVTLPDYFIATAPVTCIEYLAFLNTVAAVDLEAAKRHAPRTKPDGGALWDPGADGRYALPKYDADGNPVVPRAPVMGVSFFDAAAYCSWRSQEDGVAYRLPTEEEWEKAARGVDGRFFPWGNGFDPTFCKMATSRPGRPQPEPVMSFPVDESVYGMRDAAGGIREWCDSFYDAAKETRSLRGGAWYFNPSFCRVAFRHGYLPHIVFTNFGFRLAKSAPRTTQPTST